MDGGMEPEKLRAAPLAEAQRQGPDPLFTGVSDLGDDIMSTGWLTCPLHHVAWVCTRCLSRMCTQLACAIPQVQHAFRLNVNKSFAAAEMGQCFETAIVDLIPHRHAASSVQLVVLHYIEDILAMHLSLFLAVYCK